MIPSRSASARLRSRLRALQIAPFLFVAAISAVEAQRTQDNLSAGNPTAFDTEDPAAYTLDFPFIPDSDPIREVSVRRPPPLDILNDQGRLQEFQLREDIPNSPRNPSFFNREDRYILSDAPSNRIDFADNAFSEEGLTLSEVRPSFYFLSKTVAAFNLGESTVGTLLPFIPTPVTVFADERATRFRVGAIRLAFEGLLTTAQVSNVFGSTTNPQSDIAFTFTPKFYLEAGTRGLLRLYYSPTFLRYGKYTELDRLNQIASITVQYPWSKLTLVLEANYQTESGLFLESQGQSTQSIYFANLDASYRVTEKTAFTLETTSRYYQTDPGGNKFEQIGSFLGNYRIGDKLTAGVIFRLGSISAEGGHQNYQTAQLQINYRPTNHFLLLGEAGVQRRTLSPETAGLTELDTPIFDLTGSYFWTENALVLLRAYREFTDDTFSNVNFSLVTGIEAAAKFRFFQKGQFQLDVKAGTTDQYSNVAPERRNYDFVQGGFRISYPIIRGFEVIVFDNIQKRLNDSQGNNYVSNTIGVGLDFRF